MVENGKFVPSAVSHLVPDVAKRFPEGFKHQAGNGLHTPHLAFASESDWDRFWDLFDRRNPVLVPVSAEEPKGVVQ